MVEESTDALELLHQTRLDGDVDFPKEAPMLQQRLLNFASS